MKALLLSILAVLWASSCTRPPEAVSASSKKVVLRSGEYAIPAGTELKVRTEDILSTERAEPGGRIVAKLQDPIVVDGKQAAPAGAEATLRVIDAEPGRRGGKAARLTIRLTQVWPGTGAPAIETHTPALTRTNLVAGTQQLAGGQIVPGLAAPDPNLVHVEIGVGTTLAFVLESPAVVSPPSR